jgi:hypothetical protein
MYEHRCNIVPEGIDDGESFVLPDWSIITAK